MRRLRRQIALLTGLAALAGWTVAFSSSHAPVFPPLAHVQRWRLSLPAQPDSQPADAGNTVAYATRACAACHPVLYVAGLAGRKARQIAQLPLDTVAPELQLSPTWLVWLTEGYARPGWQLLAWSQASGRRRLIDSSLTEGGPVAPSSPEFSLSGNVLAWVRHDCLDRCTRPGPSTLRLIDLQGGTARVIAHTSYVCRPIGFPALSDTVLTWVGTPLNGWGCPAPQTWTIVLQDRRTDRVSFHEIHLTRNQIADEFTGYGQWEAWTEHLEYTNRDDRVVLMNLQSGTQRTITGYGRYSPRLAGRALAWIGGNGAGVEALDLGSGRRYLLAHDVNKPNQIVALAGRLGTSGPGRVIWTEGSFSPNGGPIHDSLVVAAVP